MGSYQECALLQRATQFAQEKGLLRDGKPLSCGYASICSGLRCLLVENPLTRFFPLIQGQTPEQSYSGVEQFYSRLQKTMEIRLKAG